LYASYTNIGNAKQIVDGTEGQMVVHEPVCHHTTQNYDMDRIEAEVHIIFLVWLPRSAENPSFHKRPDHWRGKYKRVWFWFIVF
jgi:hypothetical protein